MTIGLAEAQCLRLHYSLRFVKQDAAGKEPVKVSLLRLPSLDL